MFSIESIDTIYSSINPKFPDWIPSEDKKKVLKAQAARVAVMFIGGLISTGVLLLSVDFFMVAVSQPNVAKKFFLLSAASFAISCIFGYLILRNNQYQQEKINQLLGEELKIITCD